MVDDVEDTAVAPQPAWPRRRRVLVALTAVAVLVVAAVLVARALAGSRATPGGGFFSVRVPTGWTESPERQGPPPDAAHPDTGEMVLRGPSGREVDISWTDGPIAFAVLDSTEREVQRIPLTVAGQPVVIVDNRITGISGAVSHEGILDYAMRPAGETGDPLRRTVHGRVVQFSARCAPAGLDDGYSWCIQILSSWRWE